MQLRHGQGRSLTDLRRSVSGRLPSRAGARLDQTLDDHLKRRQGNLSLQREADRLENENHRRMRPVPVGALFCTIQCPV